MFKISKYGLVLIEICITLFIGRFLLLWYGYNAEPILWWISLGLILNIVGIILLCMKNNVAILSFFLAILLYFVIRDIGIHPVYIWNNPLLLLIYLSILTSFVFSGYIYHVEYKKQLIKE